MHGAGTPTGSCATGFKVSPACDLKAAKAKIEKECVGKSSCNIPATTAFFGSDPCFDTVKSLAISATGCNAGSKPAVFTYDVTIPTGSVRTVATASNSRPPIVPCPCSETELAHLCLYCRAADSRSDALVSSLLFCRLQKFTCQRWASRPPQLSARKKGWFGLAAPTKQVFLA